ncbi:hypothetical protein HG531_001916 [Fusarium graminearum]|nr:hypothetical protein HG531_001916 [Fusarium graminearum]
MKRVLRVDDAARSVRENKVYGYHVGIAEELISAYYFERLFAILVLDRKTGFPCLFVCRLLSENPRDVAAQTSEAEDTQCLSGEVSSKASLPQPFFHSSIIPGDTASEGKNECDAVLHGTANAARLFAALRLDNCSGDGDTSCFESVHVQGSIPEGCSAYSQLRL